MVHAPPGAPPSVAVRFRFVDLTVNETLYHAYAYGQYAAAEKLRAGYGL